MHLIAIQSGVAAAIVGSLGVYESAVAAVLLIVVIFLYRFFIYNRITLPLKVDENEKRVIFITGAASGIGLATANLFADKGWIVGFYDMNIKAVKEAVETRTAKTGTKKCHYGFIDVTDASSCETALNEFLKHANVDHLDCLFNCAGLLAIGAFDELPLARQVKQVDVNVSGIVNLTYHAIPLLAKSKYGGRVVSMASGSAIGGIPLHAVYAATKAAVYSMTEALNVELYNKYNISCCDISVGYVATPMVHSQNRSDTWILSQTSQYLKPEDVAKIVDYAVHHCRRHREHFYDPAVWVAFKFGFFNRAFGSRILSYFIEFTNSPQGGWKGAATAKSDTTKKDN